MSKDSKTLIDHIYTSNCSGHSESGCVDAGVSDHLMVNTVRMGRKVTEIRRSECLRILTWMAYWKSLVVHHGKQTVWCWWNHWKSTFLNILDQHAPVVTCHMRKSPLPWIDADIRKLRESVTSCEARAAETVVRKLGVGTRIWEIRLQGV